MVNRTLPLFAMIAYSLTLASCNKSDDKSGGTSANLPLVTPPVKIAIPASLQGTASLNLDTPTSALSERFFSANEGPSNIFRILKDLDTRLSGINAQTAQSNSACVTQAPVAYTINPLGQDVTLYGQCYETLAAGAISKTTGLIQFGVKDGITYLYTFVGAEEIAAIATPIAGTDGKYTIQAWIGLGEVSATWDSGSYGLMELKANSSTATVEFAAAGLGLGYCGAQLKSDGTNILSKTSADMGETCVATENACVLASDATTEATCSDSVTQFDLTPIGRHASIGATNSYGASQYPETPNVILGGLSIDSAHFGPTTPSAGLNAI